MVRWSRMIGTRYLVGTKGKLNGIFSYPAEIPLWKIRFRKTCLPRQTPDSRSAVCMRKPDPTEGKVVIFVVVFLTVGGLSIGDPIALVDDARTVIGAGLLESYDSEKDLYCLTPKDGVDMMGFPPARNVNTIGKHHRQAFSHRLFRAHELPRREN